MDMAYEIRDMPLRLSCEVARVNMVRCVPVKISTATDRVLYMQVNSVTEAICDAILERLQESE